MAGPNHGGLFRGWTALHRGLLYRRSKYPDHARPRKYRECGHWFWLHHRGLFLVHEVAVALLTRV